MHVRKTVKGCRWDEKWPFALPVEWEKIVPRLTSAAASQSSTVVSFSPASGSTFSGSTNSAPPVRAPPPLAPSLAGHSVPPLAVSRYSYDPIPTGAILPPPPMRSLPRPATQDQDQRVTYGPPPSATSTYTQRPAQPHSPHQEEQISVYPHPHYHSLANLNVQEAWFRPSAPAQPASTLSGRWGDDVGGAIGGQASRSSSASSASSGAGFQQNIPSPAELAQAAHAARPVEQLTPEIRQWFYSLPLEQQERMRHSDPRTAAASYQASPYGQHQMMQQWQQQQQQIRPPSYLLPPSSSTSYASQDAIDPVLGGTWPLSGFIGGVPLAPALRGVGQVGLASGSALASVPTAASAKVSLSASPSLPPALNQEHLFRAGEPSGIGLSVPVQASVVADIAERANAAVLEQQEQLDAASTAATAGNSSVAADPADADRSPSPSTVNATYSEDGSQHVDVSAPSMEAGTVSTAGQAVETPEDVSKAGSDSMTVPASVINDTSQPRSSSPVSTERSPSAIAADLFAQGPGTGRDPSAASTDRAMQDGAFSSSSNSPPALVVASSRVRPSAVPAAAMPEIRPGTPTSPSAIVLPQGSPEVIIPLHEVINTDAMEARSVDGHRLDDSTTTSRV